MRFLRRITLNQRGDTIVEVLISIAIISLVLGGAFVTANRSLQQTRDAQERQNALKTAESQVEQIKSMADGRETAETLFNATGSYCLRNSLPIVSTDAQCRVNADGNPTTTEPAYRLSVSRVGNTFTVLSNWNGSNGTPNNVELKYRVYQ